MQCGPAAAVVNAVIGPVHCALSPVRPIRCRRACMHQGEAQLVALHTEALAHVNTLCQLSACGLPGTA
jgi:hypothetical protein